MTTYSSVSMDFGGFKKNSPMIFQNDERSPMDFKGWNVCSSPNDEEFGEIKPSVYAGLRALGYCSLQRLLQQIFNEI